MPLRRPGQVGCPPIYCSAPCRPSWARPAILVEVERSDSGDGFSEWVVRLRRGQRVVVAASGLGRFSATALGVELRAFLGDRSVGEAS